MDFSGKHVIVTGGTGALGIALVNMLVGAGAICRVPYIHETERFPRRGDPNVTLIAVSNLADEEQVAKLYAGVKPWASIHLAGGFAGGKVAETDKTALIAQIDNNLTSCFLCCRAAVNAMLAGGQGGRIVNVAAAGAGVAQRRRYVRLRCREGRRRRTYRGARRGVAKDGILVKCGRAFDHGHAGQS
jgi:NAD(P)-dependent dehydrogenase (short-subunit alcohol dehydrogenase family)